MIVTAFFVKRGHTLDEMLNLTLEERLVYTAIYLDYCEQLEEAAEGENG